MIAKIKLASILFVASFAACSVSPSREDSTSALLLPDMQQNRYLASGSIILSRELPAERNTTLAKLQTEDSAQPMAPIFGYVPPAKDFLPAINETWIEIDTANRTLIVFNGKNKIKVAAITGFITVPAGSYVIKSKQNAPLWNATGEYFTKRDFPVPTSASERRLRGALGSKALFTDADVVIHSAPFWTEDVGGLRISSAEMQDIYSKLAVGSAVVVR